MTEQIKFRAYHEKMLLKLGVKTRFLRNRVKYCNETGDDIYGINTYKDFVDFILCAFKWIKTPEGREFWCDVSKGKKPI